MAYVSPPIQLNLPDASAFSRADIHFEGVEQGGPSFEARVFINNPNADENTPLDPEHGYAGSFHVYGYGYVQTSPPRLPMHRYLTATDAIKAARAKGDTITVSVVPVLPEAVLRRTGDPLKIERVFVTFEP